MDFPNLVNPAAGIEGEIERGQAPRGKRVLVIGGVPAAGTAADCRSLLVSPNPGGVPPPFFTGPVFPGFTATDHGPFLTGVS